MRGTLGQDLGRAHRKITSEGSDPLPMWTQSGALTDEAWPDNVNKMWLGSNGDSYGRSSDRPSDFIGDLVNRTGLTR
jgi:hypothetical protein